MKLTVGGEELTVKTERYANGKALAVVVKDAEGAPYATLSVNLPQPPAPNCFWLKDWSENEDVALAALAAGVVELTGRRQQSGFVEAKEARLVTQP